MKIDLPDENWVSLREPDMVPERLRRPVMRAFAEASERGDITSLERVDLDAPDAPEQAKKYLTTGFLDLMNDVNDHLAVALIEEWSFTTPDGAALPVTLDTVQDLPAKHYTAVQKAVAPLFKEVLPDFGPSPDPKALGGSSPA